MSETIWQKIAIKYRGGEITISVTTDQPWDNKEFLSRFDELMRQIRNLAEL